MYSAGELFSIASEARIKEAFLSNVTLSIPDDACGCVDLDAEKERLCKIWDLAKMPFDELVKNTGLSQTDFAKNAGIPRRTVQNWCGGVSACPSYTRFLLAKYYNLL